MSRIIFALLVGTFAVTYVSARCDNQCSGHGTCMTDDVCQCYDNWGAGLSHDSADCSDRICPFEIAWVDTPDINGRHHKYMECAGKGICDRATGECQCFDGFEGKACARSACPNDCSGHGVCEYIEDLPYGATWNDYGNPLSTTYGNQPLFSDVPVTFPYPLWDKTKSRKCVCDATYGDLDCSKMLCPYGTDVLDTKDSTYFGINDQKYQEQVILFSALSGDALGIEGQTFALTFTSRLNETFTTIPIVLTNDGTLDNDIKLALLKLPNGVIDGVTVTSKLILSSGGTAGVNDLDAILTRNNGAFNRYAAPDTTFGIAQGPNSITYTGLKQAVLKAGIEENHRRLTNSPYFAIKIRFTGPSVQGPQHLLIVEDYLCGDGCTPKLSGLALETRFSKGVWSTVVEITASDFNSYECGRRGKCDYTTGLCQCFAGYIGDNCNTLTTLV